MFSDRASLADVAERIASAESRHSRLVVRINRLKDEGGDTTQEKEMLSLLATNLAQLYA